jgi:signal transduction histidine kinase
MRRQVDRELARARLARGAVRAAAEARTVVDRVVQVLRRTPAGSRLDWQVRVPPGHSLRIDDDDLTEALGALLENAARHARTTVTVTAAASEDRIVLVLADDGPGIAAERLARLEAGDDPDAGFGLTIAKEAIEAAGGTLTLTPAGPGLAVRMTLPRAEPSPHPARTP